MKISVFQGVMFGVFGILALVGLFAFATYSGKRASSDTVGKVVIWGTLPSAPMQTFLTGAVQADQSLKGVAYVEKSAPTLASDLATAIATGNGPDMILASQEELTSLAKFVQPLPSSVLSPSAVANAFVGEAGLLAAPDGSGYYGVPFLVDPLVLFSNRAILSSSGVAKPPATWEALTGLVPTLAQLSPSRQVLRGLIGLGTYGNVHNARGILSTLFLQQDVPMSSYGAGGVPVADLRGGRGLSGDPVGGAVLVFYTQFADPTKVSYTWNGSLDDSQAVFAAGNLALYLGYASEARFLRDANPNLDYAVSPVPQPGTAKTKAVYGLMYSFLIPRGSANGNGAFQTAVKFSAPALQAAAAAATSLAPVSLTALSSPPSDTVGSVAYSEALYSKGWLSPEPAATDRVFSGMIQDVISGRLAPVTALGNAESSLSSLFQK
ncbi:MAG TPA: extracellular solute-binding protein [Candidatus Paceibacterota bacterium]|nr:extracellular solute-binding protein [Candidatus Paceibacterota bacterium]